ncbi:efflux RND transporter periplasmic adaptor subunit [Shewanella algidipiscicola]|uniref:MexH family multidrug efflux RND transporter periplasmic adaptor subunit n=1 Tax=Shewanella algidipiscicola TaxID=614070 RepID=A0ABQ4PJP0_9GAMM|nr:efflux RND transporter periplasmic adaptor subunit [Shewanella algidipiscicola]GIU47829.1 MexH family multidrug efflux RND transporter periplasmic adaptor subunit [Shewanella algidipiscicola]
MKKPRLTTSTIIILSLSAALLIPFILSPSLDSQATEGSEQVAKKMRVIPVVTSVVAQQELSQHLSLVGKLEANRSVQIAAEVAGKITRINVDANQAIVAGQTLVVLEHTRAKANVAQAQAYWQDEQRKLTEFQKLIGNNAITQTEIDAQKASVDIALARLQAAQAELDLHLISAPFSGTAGLVDFSVGKMVSVGSELLSLDDLASMRLDIQVPELYLSRLQLGMSVTATSRAWPDERFVGHVVAIDPRINPETLNLKVRVNFDNPQQKLKPGMLMSANIGFAPIKQPIVPVQALEYSGTKRFVYIIDSDNVARRTQVTLSARIDDKVLISEGVNSGDKIVVQGLVNMRDGLKIEEVASAHLSTQETLASGDDVGVTPATQGGRG